MSSVKNPFKNSYLLITILVITYLVITLFIDFHNQSLIINFLNIGQGDACLIKTPKHHTIIVDGGPDQKLSLAKISSKLPFYDRSIDLVVLTHNHADHLNGLIEIIDDFDIGAILITGVISNQEMYKTFLNKILKHNIKIFFAESTKDFYFDDDVYLDILYPFTNQKNKRFKNLNNASIVFNLHYKDKKILFTGDLEEDLHPFITKYKKDIQTDILKVAHHGSRNGTTEMFLENVLPSIGILSYGINNKFKHPHQEALDLLNKFDVKICRTIENNCTYIFK